MKGTCRDCKHCNTKESRWMGTHYGPGCDAVEDGIHPLGWGGLIIGADGKPERTAGGLLRVELCYYWEEVEEYRQMEMFGGD